MAPKSIDKIIDDLEEYSIQIQDIKDNISHFLSIHKESQALKKAETEIELILNHLELTTEYLYKII